ncbi:hypothetical protein H5410_015273 [Solanum commersonii]|uniref:Uncharacterized protein n=1 Tax=Solanum commersonii TaxID=4109 RepID=A0A9J5ZTB9_SOLCO|nr:hypothetical protein H5410_015273 [Solanum commersonii]
MALPNGDNGDETREVLAAQAHIWNHTFNFISTMSLKCAIQLGIPDIIHSRGRAMTLSDLVNPKVMIVFIVSCWIQYGGDDQPSPFATTHGGNGTIAKAIAEAFPQINCTVLYLAHVIEGSKNLSYVGGDMFKSVPSADAVLLKWILHDWGNEDCIKILKKCKEAIPSKENGGKVIIIDMVILDSQKGDDKSYKTQIYMDMLTMVVVSRKQKTEQEWAKLFFDAGYSDYNIIPILGLRCVIEVYP